MKARLPVRQAILRRRTYEGPEEGRAGKLRLDFNENTVGCSRAVCRALARLTPELIAMYPEYEAPTRRLAKYFGVRREEFQLANGADDVLRNLFDTFVDAGSGVLLCEPTFSMYRFYAEIAGAKIATLRYGPELEFPLKQLLAALRKHGRACPRLLILANPNNPTGTLLSFGDMRKILRAARHTAVAIDEAYAEFSGQTLIPWIRRHPNLFVIRTFSKAAGLAALRLGCLFAQRDALALVRRSAQPYPINIAALVAAEAAVQDKQTMRGYVREVLLACREFETALQRLGVKTYPSAANFLLADFGSAGPRLLRRLQRDGILLRDRSKEFGRPGVVRISIGTRKEMRRVVKAIERHR